MIQPSVLFIRGQMGCSAETLRNWVRQPERDQGRRPGLTTDERKRLKELWREDFELKRANGRGLVELRIQVE